MKTILSKKYSRFIMGLVLFGAFALFLSQSTSQTSASQNDYQINLATAQDVEYCQLISNGDFEDGVMPWITSGEFKITAGRTGNGLSIITPYARQRLAAEPNKDFTITGYYKTSGEFGPNWTGIGIDFLDGVMEISEQVSEITEPEEEFIQFEISGTTPENTSAIRVWFYSGNGVTMTIDDIEIAWNDCSTTPPPAPSPTITPLPTASPTATPLPPTPTPMPTPEPPQNLETNLIFDDAVSSDWILGSWGVVSLNTLAKEPVFEGENSLEISLANAFATAFFETKSTLPASDLYSVNFMVSDTNESTQTFEVRLKNKAFKDLSSSTVVVQTGEWNEVRILYSDLPENEVIKYITITNSVSSAPVYLDNIYIEHAESDVGGPTLFDNQIFLPLITR